MIKKKFFKLGSLADLGNCDYKSDGGHFQKVLTANFSILETKNIIFMVSDGMSSGMLNMVNIYSERIQGKTGNWMQLYADRKVSCGLMD